jgi:N-carbamoyl-L-amino-acid hydrolase
MMFVQSLNGLSHNAAEDTKREHLEQAVAAFGLLAEKTSKWIVAV